MQLTQVPLPNGNYNITFNYDTDAESKIIIYISSNIFTTTQYPYISIIPTNGKPKFQPITIHPGVKQRFDSKSIEFNPQNYSQSELLNYVALSNYFPLTIVQFTYKVVFQSLFTFLTFYQKEGNNGYEVKVVRQCITYHSLRLEVYDVYNQQLNDNAQETTKECTICFERAKDALAIPCRHLVMCGPCAKKISEQQQKICPLCRKGM